MKNTPLFLGVLTFMLSSCINASVKQEIHTHTGKHKIIKTDSAPQPVGPYSQAVLTNGTLYVSGQVGINPSTSQLDTSSFENEVKQTMRNIEAILHAAKMKLENVVSVRVYLTDLQKYRLFNTIYQRYFTKNPPARETIEICNLPKGARVEISVTAAQ